MAELQLLAEVQLLAELQLGTKHQASTILLETRFLVSMILLMGL